MEFRIFGNPNSELLFVDIVRRIDVNLFIFLQLDLKREVLWNKNDYRMVPGYLISVTNLLDSIIIDGQHTQFKGVKMFNMQPWLGRVLRTAKKQVARSGDHQGKVTRPPTNTSRQKNNILNIKCSEQSSVLQIKNSQIERSLPEC